MHSPYQSHLPRSYKRLDSAQQKLFRQLKKVKYPVLAIQPAQQLSHKLQQFSKDQKLYQQMTQKLIQQKQLTAYRKIRGDGNCFFRALAFQILSNSRNLASVEQTFYQLNEISLTSCYQKSIPKEFKPYYNDMLLKQVLKINWPIDVKHYQLLCKMNNRRILSRMFRKNPYLDFVVVLYFRSLCLKGLQKHLPQVKEFMKGTQQQQVRTYGQQSQGVVLDICSRYMKISVEVYEVRKQELKHYSYSKAKLSSSREGKVSLLYYENHYDIIESISEEELKAEQEDTHIKEEEYYSMIDETMMEGQCIQCGKAGYIYEENSLCEGCFVMSKNELLNTMKGGETYRTGLCRECGKNNVKVLQMIELCQSCVKRQQMASQSPKKNANQNSKPQPPHQPYFNQQQQQRQQQEIGICLQCDKRELLDPETKLCSRCKSMQKQVLLRQDQRKEIRRELDRRQDARREEQRKRICLQCNSPTDSQIHHFMCVEKLTKAKIGEKQHYSDRKCKICAQLRMQQDLANGICSKCYNQRKVKQSGVKDPNGQGSKIDPQQKSGQTLSQVGEKCVQCKKPVYSYKLQNGVCIKCKSSRSEIKRF